MGEDNGVLRPVIGLTAGRDVPGRPDNLTIPRTYPDAVVAAGGVPVVVTPMHDARALRQLFSTLDGVILPGGLDVQPSAYGEPAHPTTRVDPVLDVLEFEIARWAIAEALPTLGICRGHQLINVALGGSLIQDLPSVKLHHWQREQSSTLTHALEVDGDSKFAGIFGVSSLRVNSFHHQAIDRLGRGLRAVGWSPDGVIEAIESADHPWLLAVQFHPEDLIEFHEPSQRLFRAFVEACGSSSRGGAVLPAITRPSSV